MSKQALPTISLSGGLGNQLFQWVGAHYFFSDTGFRVDLGHYRINLEREFQLNPLLAFCQHIRDFNPASRQISKMKFLEWATFRGVSGSTLRLLGYVQEFGDLEGLTGLIQQMEASGKRIYLNGLFQNGDIVDLAFSDVELEMGQVTNHAYLTVTDKFSFPQKYAAVHVRRGDYPFSQIPSKAIGQLDDTFFTEVAAKTDLPIILLTENTNDVTELIKTLKPVLVLSQKEADPWQCLAIMEQAEFLIGSNSSLSWWGAYLASRKKNETWLPKEWSQWGNYSEISLTSENHSLSPSAWRLV